ncbi:MAG TPA: hypothetical protein PKB10_02905 [Tepidisphaeraceae bacterium]|nr:hypothetical protein [Tepidisphaeraceae bacterium]
MDTYSSIEKLVADQYGKPLGARKAIGDFMLSETHAVNVKSNNTAKQNYSPNMISIQKMHKWVFEDRNDLSFVFVDYRMEAGAAVVIRQSELVPIELIDWQCLTIEAQGYGVIQMCRKLIVVPTQTKAVFYRGFLDGYVKYLAKERRKHEQFARRFIDPSSIDW